MGSEDRNSKELAGSSGLGLAQSWVRPLLRPLAEAHYETFLQSCLRSRIVSIISFDFFTNSCERTSADLAVCIDLLLRSALRAACSSKTRGDLVGLSLVTP